MQDITREEVEEAQLAWADGIIKIGCAWTAGDDCQAVARAHVDSLYGYAHGQVMFKPTLAAENQFRNTYESALSYFVGGNDEHSEDSGFALKPWSTVRFENSNVICLGTSALAMGNYFFTGADGVELKVEFSFSYIRGPSGALQINLHHSSLPHSR